MTALSLKRNELYNPIDVAETVMMDRDWVFDRPDDGELIAEAKGAFCNLRIWFNWDENNEGLSIACALDSKPPRHCIPKLHPLLAMVNEKLWLGHFDVSSDDGEILFRHALLLKHDKIATAAQLEELIDIAIEECDRFYPAFQAVVWGGKPAAEALAYSLFETVAEA